MAKAQPTSQVDLGEPESTCDVLVIGCGNLLRGDDGVGPILIRHLWDGGIPDGIRLVDGGTAGMDVSFAMHGAGRVILIDACATGAEPGTIFKVPGPELEQLPELSSMHTHSFRWDHALAFARWLLGDDGYPSDVTVYLIEAYNVAPGADLSEPVEKAMREVIDLIRQEPEFASAAPGARDDNAVTVELTAEGNLRIPADAASRYFPSDSLVAMLRDNQLLLLPLRSSAAGGLVLKQRNMAGDRSVILREVLRDDFNPGLLTGTWDESAGAVRFDWPAPSNSERADIQEDRQ